MGDCSFLAILNCLVDFDAYHHQEANTLGLMSEPGSPLHSPSRRGQRSVTDDNPNANPSDSNLKDGNGRNRREGEHRSSGDVRDNYYYNASSPNANSPSRSQVGGMYRGINSPIRGRGNAAASAKSEERDGSASPHRATHSFVMGNKNEILQSLFIACIPEKNVVLIKLHVDCQYHLVPVAPTLPISHDGKILCAHSTIPQEIWICLLEKAYVTITGGNYDFFGKGSNPNTDGYHLTGWVPETLPINFLLQQINIGQ